MTPPLSRVFLDVGQVYCGRQPAIVSTVLGSCVSVSLWDRRLGIGGLNHFQLPKWNDRNSPTPRYGDIAMDALFDEMLRLGCCGEDLVAKVFGGAAMYGPAGSGVGSANIDMADAWLRRHGFRVAAECTGGSEGRHLQLFTVTGEVRVRPVARLDPARASVE